MEDKKTRIGRYVTKKTGDESYECYIPNLLPPRPPVDLSQFYNLLDKAGNSLGRLNSLGKKLPNINILIYMYVRKEAVLSSQIEGTQSSLSDLLLFEGEKINNKPIDDIEEVCSYVLAMNYGLKRLETLPLSLRLLKETHEKLMKNSRGSSKEPGEFRRSQNWIGGKRPSQAIFFFFPVENLNESLGDLEKFLHDESLPVLVKIAIAHLQFETIHPFLDGNGRLGRLLITLILCNEKFLEKPFLYMSLYLKTHRQEYYRHLNAVRKTGDWESWIHFFLKGVLETSEKANQKIKNILELFETDRKKIQSHKKTTSILEIYNCFKESPFLKTETVRQKTNYSLNTVISNLSFLEDLGIIKEITGKQRVKIFCYENFITLLEED